MRFKKLELLGFKTFAETTEFLFEPGVTAIVGPNGVGKSNVADALKWVLGEQSARELRGGRMEDLIFNGSDRREPLSYTEVSLTLDNSNKLLPIDYTEVVISRRLYRSGESEYLLNRTPVRLKDITELLMGTGIGTSAYSLFEQGRIEQIISARPEERRTVFEEAAGITKFKAQKREALRRLDETEANLLRVSDVIAEVKRQIQALERQVKRAKVYKEQFEELKRLEVKLARVEEDQLRSQWQERQKLLSGLRESATSLTQRLESQEELLEKARGEVYRAEESLTHAREALLQVSHRQETTKSHLELMGERMGDCESRGARLEEELSHALRQTEQFKEQMASLKVLLSQQETERQSKEQEMELATRDVERCTQAIEEAKRKITEIRESLLEETGLEVQLKNELNKVHQEANRVEARLSRLTLEETKVSSELQEAISQVKQLEERLTQARQAKEALLQELGFAQEGLEAAESSLREMTEKKFRLEQETVAHRSKLELFRGLLASHEGYSSGLKALLTALEKGTLNRDGINGVLAELILVAPEETAAVEAALGPFAQALVVESATVAERCRQFLERNRAGRVLFLLSKTVPAPSGTGSESRGAVPLLSRIGITPHLEPLLRLLLADTWLVPDRESALALATSAGERFVTPSGELLTVVSHLLGSRPSEEGLVVGRKSRLQSLEVALRHAEHQLQAQKARVDAMEAERKLHLKRLESLEASLEEKSQELQRSEAICASAREALSKLEQEEELLKTEKTEAEEEGGSIREGVKQWEEKLASQQSALSALQETISLKEEEIRTNTQSREEISIKLAERKAELASFDEVLQSRSASFKLLENSLKDAESQASSRQEELARLKTLKLKCEQTQRELEENLKVLGQEESRARAEVERAEGERQKAQSQASGQEREFQGISHQIEESQAKVHGLEMEEAQLNFQREQIRSRILQVYQVNLEEISPLAAMSEEVPGVREKIEELSQKLQRMGPVNLSSIEEERELLGRYEHLVTQQNDLLKAKEDLHEAITKINRTTRAMFRETFEAVQKEFQVTFRQLFGGGEARLVLLDEEDLLESGIEIIARPPGKMVQAISLLSGGEKALTTIALLFAIFRVKPSPFCLMDEVDAPLDEANIDRFAGTLKEFLKDSQFIIITHNKRTITMADVMYGITMEESGVSKIVSVRFKEGKETREGKEVKTGTTGN